MADFTKYIFNDNEYVKRRLVLAVVEQYMLDRKPSLSSLLDEFPAELQGNYGALISEDDFNRKYKNNDDPVDRYFLRSDEVLVTSDGINVFVSSQWGTADNGPGNFDRFLNKAKDLGFEIKVKRSAIKTIKDLFEEYKESPRSDWMAGFKETSEWLLSYKNKSTL